MQQGRARALKEFHPSAIHLSSPPKHLTVRKDSLRNPIDVITVEFTLYQTGGLAMISEKLEAISQGKRNFKPRCRVPEILEALSESDSSAVIRALKNPSIPRRQIMIILGEEGHPVSRDAVVRATECLSGNRSCECNLPGRDTK